ncbi:hypothetical protein LCGC14_0392710 [marine sediment metagenome]|uniref:Uncharacterized protein n=1 Tax=marine sediment metagenome TaxID=412755 RepID=A0A0F9SYZ0_9ZZZZ
MAKRLLPGVEYPKVNQDGGLQITEDIVVQDYIKYFGDRTLLTGGAITDNGDGTIAVASGTAWAKVTDSDIAIGKFFDFSANNSVSLTDLTTNYIYLDYNDGTPQMVVATSLLTHGFKQDHILVGTAFRDDTISHFHHVDTVGIGRMGRVDMHHREEEAVHRVEGMVTSSVGTRNLNITAGVLYEGISRHDTSPFTTPNSGTADGTGTNKLIDSGASFVLTDVGKTVHNTTDDTYAEVTARDSGTQLTLSANIFISGESYDLDSFTYWYTTDSGSTWTEVRGTTAISNTQYNNITVGLANLTANRYGVHWVYMEADGEHFHVLYGQGNYKVNESEEATPPSISPNIVTQYCALIAKIIVQKDTDTLIIMYPWTTVFTSSFATDHNSLANLTTGDVHTQYVKHALATAANDFLVASGSGTYVKKTLAETLALISPLTTRGDIMFMNATVNTRLAKGNDNTILAMGTDDPEWKTPATILADLSGQAGAAFAWNSQNLTSVGTLNAHTIPGGTDTFAMLAATQELDNKTLDSSVAKGTWTASGTWTVPAMRFSANIDANLFQITNSGRIGIGVVAPAVALDVLGTGFNSSSQYFTRQSDNSSAPALLLRKSRGADTAVEDEDYCGSYAGYFLNDGTPKTWEHAALIDVIIEDASDGAETGRMEIRIRDAGATNVAFKFMSDGEFWADTNVLVDEFVQVTEMTAPGAGAANTARMYADVNGVLTTANMVFQDGTVDTFATEATPLDSPILVQPSGTVVIRKMVKPHPGLIQFVEEFPDGKQFVMRSFEYHDAAKIAANAGCDSPLPAGWEVTTLQQRVDKQLDILDTRIGKLLKSKAGVEKQLAQTTEDEGKLLSEKQVIQIGEEIAELENKKQLELRRLSNGT